MSKNLHRHNLLAGTIEVSEADYRRLVDEHRALVATLKATVDELLDADPTRRAAIVHAQEVINRVERD